MFVSPCSFRSAQCAALIALATAAGIARVDVMPAEKTAETISGTARPIENFGGRGHGDAGVRVFFQLERSALAPWTQRFVAFAFRFFAGRPAASDMRASATALSSSLSRTAHATCVASAAHATAIAAIHFPPLAAVVSSIGFAEQPQAAFCTHDRLLPFAVGPPTIDVHSTPAAGDTEVSCNPTAHGLTKIETGIASLAGVSADARLACSSCLNRTAVGPVFSSRRSARTESLPRKSTASLCACARLRLNDAVFRCS